MIRGSILVPFTKNRKAESVSTYPAQCAVASSKMGLKPTLQLWYQPWGLELWLVAKEERGKPSVRLVAATGADGDVELGWILQGWESLRLCPQRDQGPGGVRTQQQPSSLGGHQHGKGELDVVVRSQELTLLTAGGPEQSLGAEDFCIPSLRQSLAVHNQCQRALGSVLGLLR